jgi:hypothetical protein
VSGGAVWMVLTMPPTVLDVALLHRAGGEALFSGSSPWVGLAVPDGSSTAAPGSVIDGYPYPLVTLVVFGAAARFLGGPVAAGFVCWGVIAAASWVRPAARQPAILLTAAGCIPLMIWAGWTEVLTVALLALAMRFWSRPIASGLLLGLALASKQYLVVATPFLLAALVGPDPQWSRRAARAAVVAVIGSALGLLWGLEYLDATISLHAGQAVRPESYTLAGTLGAFGVHLETPSWLGIGAGMAWASWRVIARSWTWRENFFAELATTLAIVFTLSPIAHANYWFLVWGLLLLHVGRRSVPDRHTITERASQ